MERQPIRGSGKELKDILIFLNELGGGMQRVKEIAEGVDVDGRKAVRLVNYAMDKNWIYCDCPGYVRIGDRCRIAAPGVEKLGTWTDEDDELII